MTIGWGADLVVEVVSKNDPKRDLETKLREYAAAGIPEYWIVDPMEHSIEVYQNEQGASALAQFRGVNGAGGIEVVYRAYGESGAGVLTRGHDPA